MNYILLLVRSILILLFLDVITSCSQIASSEDQSYLPIDDTNYPYSGLPRIVIETKNFSEIRDNETYISGAMQIYGEKDPSTNIIPLRLRGRGNASFKMHKYSYKLKFEKKTSLLGFPEDREWNLIANAADKSLLQNFITLKLSSWLGSQYEPRAQFVELYLNREYLGVYLFSEQIKANKNRLAIPKTEFSFLLEKSTREDSLKNHIKTNQNNLFVIRYPDEPSSQQYDTLSSHFNQWENYLKKAQFHSTNSIENWLDMDSFYRMYWIQEFSKNIDGAFQRSIFLTWERSKKIKFGPVWDFDMAYGNCEHDELQSPTDWYVKYSGWNKFILRDSVLWRKAIDYWQNNHQIFSQTIDSLDIYQKKLQKASENEFRRWPVLNNDESWVFQRKYKTYKESVTHLQNWISNRIKWIDENIY